MGPLAVLIALGVILFMATNAQAKTQTKATDLANLSPADRLGKIKAIINSNVTQGFDPDIAFLMADMENGFSIGMYTTTFMATNSLFNRHQGNGQIGVPNSDGLWSGTIYNAGAADPNLRIYDSLEDSVLDFMNLMNDPLYADALEAAQRNDFQDFIAAVANAGYSAQKDYQSALTSRAHSLGFLA